MSILAVLEQRGGAVEPHVVRDAGGGAAARARTGAAVSAPPCWARASSALAAELATKQAGQGLRRRARVAQGLHARCLHRGAAPVDRRRPSPSIVLFPHTYQVRDFLPKLATALEQVAVSDVVAHRIEDGKLVLVRQLFQGK